MNQWSKRPVAWVWLFLTLNTLPISSIYAEGVALGRQVTSGKMLLTELNCVACHQTKQSALQALPRKAPLLNEVGQRVTPQYLSAFLKDPQAVKAGTPMPHLLHGAKNEQDIEALVHFLVSQGGPIDQFSSGASEYQITQGEKLFHTVGCVACHQPISEPPENPGESKPKPGEEPPMKPDIPKRPSIPLGDLARKTTVEALTKFLRDPLHVRPSGRMPNLNLTAGEARLIASYLLREQLSKGDTGFGVGLDYALYNGAYQKVPDFGSLTPVQEGSAKQFDLKEVKPKKGRLKNNFAVRFHGMIDIVKPGKYTFYTRSDDGSTLKIDEKIIVNNDGVHPPQNKEGSIELTKGRHGIEVGFTQLGGGFELKVWWQPPEGKKAAIPPGHLLHGAYAMIPKGRFAFTVDKAKAAQGQKIFTSAGCASCHEINNEITSELKAPALDQLKSNTGGCLSGKVKAGLPAYALSVDQRKALSKALASLKAKREPLTVAQQVHQTMTTFNCYACHRRGEQGGIDSERDPYFIQLVPADLGEEGRMPPKLDGVGAKLTLKGFEKYLFEGQKIRTYMATRMPLFGKGNVRHLPTLLQKADASLVADHKPTFSGRMIDDGRRLVGKDGLGCVNCHAWNGKTMPGVYGLDLTQVTDRLNPGWYHEFMKKPARFKPQTRMPEPWPGGQVFFKDIQGGSIPKQIDAIWAYLSRKDKGGSPAGLTPGDQYLLEPTNKPIVFRTFLGGIGAHAIAVGFRQRTHVAFDALRVRMAKTWTGSFLSAQASWAGRAGQYAPIPSGNIIDFAPDSPFAILESEANPWPKVDPKRRAEPEDWTFKGYRFSKERNPIFRYQFKGIDIEEEPATDYLPSKAMIKRRFKLTTAKPVDNVYLRLAVGNKIEQNKSGKFVVEDNLEYSLKDSTRLKPIIRSVDGKRELIVPIQWQRGNTDKAFTAELEVTLKW